MKNFVLVISLLIFNIIFSQNTGTINGRIIDIKSQLPLERATIILSGTTYGTVTNNEGYFLLENIPSNTYNIIVSYLGYETQTQYNVIVKSVGNIPLLFELNELSEALEEIIVTRSPFKNKSETPLSTQTFSVVEIETYPGGNNDITKVVQQIIAGFLHKVIYFIENDNMYSTSSIHSLY